MKTIKQFISIGVLVFAVSLNTHAQQTITPDQAAQYMNDSVTVCGRIVYSIVPNVSKKEPVQLCMEKEPPNQPLTIVITELTRKAFSYDPEKKLVNKEVCINGVITTFRDKPAIMISNEAQFTNVKE